MEKTYEGFLNLFKKKNKENKKIPNAEDLETCFLDLRDEGFDIGIVLGGKVSYYDYISIHKPNELSFEFSSVKETLLFAIPYIMDTYVFKLIRIDVREQDGAFDKHFNSVEHVCEFYEIRDEDIEYIQIAFWVEGVSTKKRRTDDTGPH